MVRESHREFARSNDLFKKICEFCEIKPTKRQAAKYRDGRGTAYERKADFLRSDRQ